MKERGILFSAPMVRALLDGTKTQTRRPLKVRCQEIGERDDGSRWPWSEHPDTAGDHWHACPYGQPGDRLWVRETWRGVVEISPPGAPIEHGVARYVPDEQNCRRVEYAATHELDGEPWRPSIHMPRWASRILLEVVSVHVERLQDISRKDAVAEGLHRYEHFWRDCEYPLDDIAYEPAKRWPTRYSCPVQAYQALWESINGAGSWDANPWVWVVEFRRIEL